MKTYILGKRSYLSISLKKKIKNSFVISNADIFELERNKSFNLIINTFYPSKNLSNMSKYEEFYDKSVMQLARTLDKIHNHKINKIIYSSSSSIYNSIKDYNLNDNHNRYIYSTTKLACENLIKNFCSKKKISFNIARIFNMYGENDNFSIISKLIKSYKNKNSTIFLNNNGNSVRDFVHVDTVAKTYKDFLKSKKNGTYDIGSGYGYKISDIIENLGFKNFNIKKKFFDEQEISIAQNVQSFKNQIPLDKFLIQKLNLRNKINLKKIFSKQANLINDLIQGTIIYGAGEAGRQIYLNLIKSSSNSVYCFVDDNKKKQQKLIFNKKVISYANLINLSQKKVITNIIIAIPSLSEKKLTNFIFKLNKISINVNYIPLKDNLYKDTISLSDVTESEMFSIFNRKVTKINENLVKKLQNKSVLVTGGAGSIGSEIVKQLEYFKAKRVVVFDNSELQLYELQNELQSKKVFKFVLGDILDKDLLYKICLKNKIDIIFHAAAYKHVNILENNVTTAVKNNIFGTISLLDTARKLKINTIIISTDKAARPKNILGMTKRISEIIGLNYEKDNQNKVNIVRFGNVFGSKGSAINLFIDQINLRKTITLTSKKAKRYFMSIKEACNLVLQGSQIPLSGKILILNMGKQLYLMKIIKKLISLKNLNNNYRHKIKEIGLRKGEKMSEILSINKILKPTVHKDIFIAKEPLYTKQEIVLLLDNLAKNCQTKNDNKLKSEMRNFLKNEIS